MLFERETLTQQGRMQALEELFEQTARRDGPAPEPGRVPVATLMAYGEFEMHVRYLLDAATARATTKERRSQLKKVERSLNALPDALMTSLPASPGGNWLCFYRQMIRFHQMLTDAEIGPDAEDYITIMQKMIQLAQAVGDASAVNINAGSMFALMLLQVEMHMQNPAKRKKKATRRRKKKRPAASSKK